MRKPSKQQMAHLSGFAAIALLGFSLPIGSAYADSFTYGSYSVVDEVNVTIAVVDPSLLLLLPDFQQGYFGSGQIILHGAGGKTLDVWCIDATHDLQGTGTYQTIFTDFTNNGASNGAAGGGAVIGNTILGEIGALVKWGDQNINSNDLSLKGLVSAAVQLAIWDLEYNGATFTSDSGAVNFLVGTLLDDVKNDVFGFAPNYNLFEVVEPGNQGLIGATPLPSTWTMMLAGLIGLGFVAHRKRRQSLALGSV